MTRNGTLVIDAVTHAFDNRPENCRVKYAELHNEANFLAQEAWLPEEFRLTREEYFRAFDAETLGRALFLESDTDIACYHSIPAWGVWHDNSPMSVGLEMRENYPGRVYCYGAVSPGEGKKAVDDLERQMEEWGPLLGVKLYPSDFINGEFQGFAMSDEKLAFPVFEKCKELGLGTVAIHKAIPLAGMPMDPYRVGDVDYAAAAFPELNFEVVHAGFAFLEESVFQLARHPNVFANLEANSALLCVKPRTVAKILGEMLFWGGPEKVIWGTGAMAFHPAPLLDAFWKLEMPEDMIEDYGYAPLTPEIKAQILGENWAKMHGLDVAELAAAAVNGNAAASEEKPRPWSGLRDKSTASR